MVSLVVFSLLGWTLSGGWQPGLTEWKVWTFTQLSHGCWQVCTMAVSVCGTTKHRYDHKHNVASHNIEAQAIICLCLNVSHPGLNLKNSHVYSKRLPSQYSFFFQTLVKTFEVCDLPVRAAKFVARKNWVITGAVSVSSWCLWFVLSLDSYLQKRVLQTVIL